ncbi:MAG: polyprenyl diphosphate synthase, partial [Gemmatimonadales bacterium]
AVRTLVEAAPAQGVRVLTLYAFSSDNWRRPAGEVRRLMALFASALRRETTSCVANGVRLKVIGRRDRLPPMLVRAIVEGERATAGGQVLDLRVAVDYSARDVIARAAKSGGSDFAVALAAAQHDPDPVPAVDLLIRTGGEQRLSDFLLWECAYAELHFTPVLWPDFSAADLEDALTEFRRRDRRFGGVPKSA